jgi:hypothetical protein
LAALVVITTGPLGFTSTVIAEALGSGTGAPFVDASFFFCPHPMDSKIAQRMIAATHNPVLTVIGNNPFYSVMPAIVIRKKTKVLTTIRKQTSVPLNSRFETAPTFLKHRLRRASSSIEGAR